MNRRRAKHQQQDEEKGGDQPVASGSLANINPSSNLAAVSSNSPTPSTTISGIESRMNSRAARSTTKSSKANSKNSNNEEDDHPDLADLEQRLNDLVDEDLFQEPKKFSTLHRVIDVLGMQLHDDLTIPDNHHTNHNDTVERNPAYKNLKEQQSIVEQAIEHLAMIHCADLNGSVVQVGRVARQFDNAVGKVRNLRKQVQEIQETLGAGGGVGGGVGGSGTMVQSSAASTTAASAMSLRELWLKKLECEASLSLLQKLDKLRGAPLQFDRYLNHACIGAAVVGLSQALDIMFSSDVAQVQALHKIMEQLMIRKQRSEEVVWEALLDVVFLRTGNDMAHQLVHVLWNQHYQQQQQQQLHASFQGQQNTNTTSNQLNPLNTTMTSTALTTNGSVVSGSDNSKTFKGGRVSASLRAGGTTLPAPVAVFSNPFLTYKLRFCLAQDLELHNPNGNDPHNQQNPNANATTGFVDFTNDHDEHEDDHDEHELALMDDAAGGPSISGNHVRANTNTNTNTTALTVSTNLYTRQISRMILPPYTLETEFDLESEERRNFDHHHYLNMTNNVANNNSHNHHINNKPQYQDHVLGLRILVESLARLKRLDDVERTFSDALELECKKLVQREQARTFLRLEHKNKQQQLLKGGRYTILATRQGGTTDLREFRRHLNGLIAAFGNVLVRVSHLAQILRHCIVQQKIHTTGDATPSIALQGVLASAKAIMERELKGFLKACLDESQGKSSSASSGILGENHNSSSSMNMTAASNRDKQRISTTTSQHAGLFSLGIIDKEQKEAHDQGETLTTKSRRSTIMDMNPSTFVRDVLFAKTTNNGYPQIRHALFFRKAIAKWTETTKTLRQELASATGEDTSIPSYSSMPAIPAIEYLDNVIQKDLLPVLQEEAVNGTVKALERNDAFDPVLDRNVYARANSNEPQDVDMCKACNALYLSTGPLFLALHRLPPGGEMYLPLVAVLEHVILTFISRVKQQVRTLCNDKTGLLLLMDGVNSNNSTSFGSLMERRKAFAQLLLAYADGDMLDVSDEARDASGFPPISPPPVDTPRSANGDAAQNTFTKAPSGVDELNLLGGVEREEQNLTSELGFVKQYLEFGKESGIVVCSDEELMKSACLAHSLLKLASLLDSRIKVRSHLGTNKTLTSTRALREAIKTIKASGLKMAKFCRADILMQSLVRLSKVCTSSTLVARDAVRIPSSVNDLGEYMTAASDNLREAAGNAVTAYTFSNLEQYIPLCLIQTVRVIAAGEGILKRAPLTMNGIEALDRSGSVLYRDLKGATSFDNSFWDIELAAISFERSASFMAMMELEMPELEAYYQENRGDFSEADFQLMFGMDGPRRKGDIGRYHMIVKRLDNKK